MVNPLIVLDLLINFVISYCKKFALFAYREWAFDNVTEIRQKQ